MTRDDIIARLESCREDMARLDVASLSIFGSVARNEAGVDSDIDILVSFSGASTFDRYMDLKALLEQATGRRVDLVTQAALRPELRADIEREAVRVA